MARRASFGAWRAARRRRDGPGEPRCTAKPVVIKGPLRRRGGCARKVAGLSKCLRRVYSVLQGCRPGVGASRRVIRPTIDHLTIATEVVVSRS